MTGFLKGGDDNYWYGKNLQGDVVRLYDDEGYTVASYAYDAWAGVRGTT